MSEISELQRRAGILTEAQAVDRFFGAASELLRVIDLYPDLLSEPDRGNLEGIATRLANAASKSRARS